MCIINMQQKVAFLSHNINELMLCDRKTVLQLIYNSPTRSKLKEKGSGTQIKISDLSECLINKIYDFVSNKINSQNLTLL
jgi:hypothetical protein